MIEGVPPTADDSVASPAARFVETLRRYLVVLAFAFWQGGFTFYAGVVIWVGNRVMGSEREVGFIVCVLIGTACRLVAVPDLSGLRLPYAPIAADRRALDLHSRSARAPEEAVRKNALRRVRVDAAVRHLGRDVRTTVDGGVTSGRIRRRHRGGVVARRATGDPRRGERE